MASIYKHYRWTTDMRRESFTSTRLSVCNVCHRYVFLFALLGQQWNVWLSRNCISVLVPQKHSHTPLLLAVSECIEYQLQSPYYCSTWLSLIWSQFTRLVLNSLFICCHHFLTALVFLFKNHKSLISTCTTLPLESTSRLIPSTLSSSFFFSLFSSQSSPAHLSHYHHSHRPLLLLFFTRNSKLTFSRNPSDHRLHCTHRTAFTDSELLNGFLLVFPITPC